MHLHRLFTSHGYGMYYVSFGGREGKDIFVQAVRFRMMEGICAFSHMLICCRSMLFVGKLIKLLLKSKAF